MCVLVQVCEACPRLCIRHGRCAVRVGAKKRPAAAAPKPVIGHCGGRIVPSVVCVTAGAGVCQKM